MEFAGRSSTPFECCTKAVRAPGQSLGRLPRLSGRLGTDSSDGSAEAVGS